MTCREFAAFILEYVSGELIGERRRVFEMHLRQCENCCHYLKIYQAAIALGRRAFEDDDASAVHSGVPEELITAILAARRC